MTTINYTVLYGLNGTENREIKPNIEFEAFGGNYKVGSYARVIDGDNIIELFAGQVINGIGTVPKPVKPQPKPKKKETLLSEED